MCTFGHERTCCNIGTMMLCITCFFVMLHNRMMRWVRYIVTGRDVALSDRCVWGLLATSQWPWCACGCFVRVVVSVMMRCDVHTCCCCVCGELNVWLTMCGCFRHDALRCAYMLLLHVQRLECLVDAALYGFNDFFFFVCEAIFLLNMLRSMVAMFFSLQSSYFSRAMSRSTGA